METEIIDRLFLELSQVTTAKTRKEIEYEEKMDVLINMVLLKWRFKCVHDDPNTTSCQGCPVVKCYNREQRF